MSREVTKYPPDKHLGDMPLSTCRFQDGTVELFQLQQPLCSLWLGGVVVLWHSLTLCMVAGTDAFEYGGIASSPVFFHISKSNVSCLLASLMRFSATLKYLGSFSMPIYCLFSMMAATQVVPLPIVLSKITPPFGYKSLSGSVADPRAFVSDGTQWSHALSEYG